MTISTMSVRSAKLTLLYCVSLINILTQSSNTVSTPPIIFHLLTRANTNRQHFEFLYEGS